MIYDITSHKAAASPSVTHPRTLMSLTHGLLTYPFLQIPGSKAPPGPARTRPDPQGPETRSMTSNQQHMTQGDKLDPGLVARGMLRPGGGEAEGHVGIFFVLLFL